MKDTVIEILQTTAQAYKIRINEECDAGTLDRYREAVEDATNIDEAMDALTDEGAEIVEYEEDPSISESSIEWSGYSYTNPSTSQKTVTTTTTTTIIL